LSGCGKRYRNIEIISTGRQNVSTRRDIIDGRIERIIVKEAKGYRFKVINSQKAKKKG